MHRMPAQGDACDVMLTTLAHLLTCRNEENCPPFIFCDQCRQRKPSLKRRMLRALVRGAVRGVVRDGNAPTNCVAFFVNLDRSYLYMLIEQENTHKQIGWQRPKQMFWCCNQTTYLRWPDTSIGRPLRTTWLNNKWKIEQPGWKKN